MSKIFGSHVGQKTDIEFYNVLLDEGINFRILKRYEQVKAIGAGAQGVVCKAYDRVLEKFVAIKKLRICGTGVPGNMANEIAQAKQVYREVCILGLVNHKNVVNLLNAFTPHKTIDEFCEVYLVMDFMDITLDKVLKINILDHSKISYLLYQLLCGVKHLHSTGIIHRDLKPTNIAANGKCELKILDFGLARKTADVGMTPLVVTRYYRSPEIILEMGYEENADIWSVGCIFGEMIKKRIIFPGRDDIKQIDIINQQLGSPSFEFKSRLSPGARKYIESRPHYSGFLIEEIFPNSLFPPIDSNYPQLTPESARDLLSKMLVTDPRNRISLDQALNHPYVSLWYEPGDFDSTAHGTYDHAVDEHPHTFLQLKALIFEKITSFEQAERSKFQD